MSTLSTRPCLATSLAVAQCHYLFLVVVMSTFPVAGVLAEDGEANKQIPGERAARELGWLSDLRRGAAVVAKLSDVKQNDSGKVNVSAYRGSTVALVGSCAPPGATNDLITEDGFYLRIVTVKTRDLRPHATWWKVMVRGRIMEVLPRNRIVVIELDGDGWFILETG